MPDPGAEARPEAGQISIVMPTAGRPEVLTKTLEQIGAEAPAGAEVIVAVEGSDAASERAASAGGAQVVTVAAGAGPGAARNAAIAEARSDLLLLFDDDVRPAPGTVAAHIEAHAADPDPLLAVMGLVKPEPPLDRSEFQRWLHEAGIQFAYGILEPGQVDGRFLWVANASLKRAGFEAIGRFDEAIGFGSEDADLGIRLTEAGGRVLYRDDLLAFHYRPTTLAATLARMERVGEASSHHPERLWEMTRPRPTNIGHRGAIAALSAAEALGVLRGPLRRAAWRALCKQAYREAYWSRRAAEGPAVGGWLARRLDARMRRSDPSSGE